jgi:hypothetical protein
MSQPDEINHAVNYAEDLAAQKAERDRQLRELQERFPAELGRTNRKANQ